MGVVYWKKELKYGAKERLRFGVHHEASYALKVQAPEGNGRYVDIQLSGDDCSVSTGAYYPLEDTRSKSVYSLKGYNCCEVDITMPAAEDGDPASIPVYIIIGNDISGYS